MQKKTPFFTTVIFLAILAVMAVSTLFTGCVSTQKTMTPEQKKAYQDSLMKAHKTELQRTLSFGYEHYRQKNLEDAIPYFRKLIYIDTTGVYSDKSYPILVDLYTKLNEPDSALWVNLKGRELFPDNPYFLKSIGYIYAQRNETDKSIEAYQQLTELEPDVAENWKLLGEQYVIAGMDEEAIDAYQKSVDLDPSDLEARNVLDDLLEGYDVYKVLELRKKLAEQFPDDMKVQLDYAQILFKVGQYKSAVDISKRVVQNQPENLVALELLGKSYQESEQHVLAINTFKKLLEIKPDDKKNLCNLALSYIGIGRYTTALSQVRKALNIDSRYGLAFITSGMVYEMAADKCVANREEKKLTFDDKLVYKMAYDEYAKAKKDLNWKSDADSRMGYLVPVIPQKSDYFMHQGQTMPEDPCYSWIQ